MKDLYNTVTVKTVLPPGSVLNTAQTWGMYGAVIDCKGFDSLTFVITLGSIVGAGLGAGFTVMLEDSDRADMSDCFQVRDSELLGTEALAGFEAGDDNKCRKLGYAGRRRYVRLSVRRRWPEGVQYLNTGTVDLAILALLGKG